MVLGGGCSFLRARYSCSARVPERQIGPQANDNNLEVSGRNKYYEFEPPPHRSVRVPDAGVTPPHPAAYRSPLKWFKAKLEL